jgi:hypothetical protein
MGVGGQHHGPAALPPGKTRYPLYRRLGGPQGRAGQKKKCALHNFIQDFRKGPHLLSKSAQISALQHVSSDQQIVIGRGRSAPNDRMSGRSTGQRVNAFRHSAVRIERRFENHSLLCVQLVTNSCMMSDLKTLINKMAAAKFPPQPMDTYNNSTIYIYIYICNKLHHRNQLFVHKY